MCSSDLSGASGGAWLGGEEEGVEAELAGTARGRGGDGGRGVMVARLRLRSGSRGRGSRRGGESSGESERAVGAAWRRPGVPGRRGGSRRWPGEAGGGGAAVRARRPRVIPLSGRKTTEEGGPGGLGRLLAGPACCGWAAQGEAPGKPLLLLFLFSIFF